MTILKFKNLPNVLTSSRLIGSFILPILIYYLLNFNIFFINIILMLIFFLVSLTDFFDGYLARKYNLESKLGKALDPIADKFFIIFPLIALLAINKIYYLWVIIFVGRELFMMGLRQISLEHNFNLSVTFLAKLKTFFQIIMVSIIIANPDIHKSIFHSQWNIAQSITIFITLFLSLFSAYQYYKSFKLKFFNN